MLNILRRTVIRRSEPSLFVVTRAVATSSNSFTTRVKLDMRVKFQLDKKFVKGFAASKPPFGFNGLGELVYKRSYSRPKSSGANEEWYETTERVVNGTFSMQKRWQASQGKPWNEDEMQLLAQEMFKRMFEMKFLPPGRGLWAMGTAITEERQLYAALNNCAFVSTMLLHHEHSDPADPFAFLMDASMLGVGVGFDTLGAGRLVAGQNKSKSPVKVVIPDSREGWVDALRKLIVSHFHHKPTLDFDYSQIRPAGLPIHGFGGVSSGYSCLKEMLESIDNILGSRAGDKLKITDIVDIMNLIGKCVVSANVRRTAEIAFGPYDSNEYISLKNYAINPHRQSYGWTSNNSVFAKLGMNYEAVCEHVKKNGEPGFAWLENMQAYGRMLEQPNHVDHKAAGGNPCMEQTLESFEMCCLVETFPARHESLQDYLKTLTVAVMYAKSVTLGLTHWENTNQVMSRNRRIGCSISGVAQFIAKCGIESLREWCDTGYHHVVKEDKMISDQLGIPASIKLTSIKPSGSVSLLAGATAGMHFPVSRFYIRRVRLPANSPLVKCLEMAKYQVEVAEHDPNTVVVSFPIDAGEGVRTLSQVTMWEQLSIAAFLQKYWADNQVSCTVTFTPEEAAHVPRALDFFQYQLKAVSFLPKLADGAYKQLPLETITEDQYNNMVSSLLPVDYKVVKDLTPDAEADKFCDSESCRM